VVLSPDGTRLASGFYDNTRIPPSSKLVSDVAKRPLCLMLNRRWFRPPGFLLRTQAVIDPAGSLRFGFPSPVRAVNLMTPLQSAHKRISACMKLICLFNSCICCHRLLASCALAPASTTIPSFILAHQGTNPNYPISIAARIYGACTSYCKNYDRQNTASRAMNIESPMMLFTPLVARSIRRWLPSAANKLQSKSSRKPRRPRN
jgi:hypothetical protein